MPADPERNLVWVNGGWSGKISNLEKTQNIKLNTEHR